jgi:hypothetical protein
MNSDAIRKESSTAVGLPARAVEALLQVGGPAARAKFELLGVKLRKVDNRENRRFCDARSMRQIALYVAHRRRACDERNERALARWNRYLKDQWELDHLGRARVDQPSDRAA